MARFSKSRATPGRGKPLVSQWKCQYFIGVYWTYPITGENGNVLTVKMFPLKVLEESKNLNARLQACISLFGLLI